MTRQELIGNGVILAVVRGEMHFNTPYLRGYLSKTLPDSPDERLAQEWDVRAKAVHLPDETHQTESTPDIYWR